MTGWFFNLVKGAAAEVEHSVLEIPLLIERAKKGEEQAIRYYREHETALRFVASIARVIVPGPAELLLKGLDELDAIIKALDGEAPAPVPEPEPAVEPRVVIP
jgi:hypothetical protein